MTVWLSKHIECRTPLIQTTYDGLQKLSSIEPALKSMFPKRIRRLQRLLAPICRAKPVPIRQYNGRDSTQLFASSSPASPRESFVHSSAENITVQYWETWKFQSDGAPYLMEMYLHCYLNDPYERQSKQILALHSDWSMPIKSAKDAYKKNPHLHLYPEKWLPKCHISTCLSPRPSDAATIDAVTEAFDRSIELIHQEVLGACNE